MAAPIAFSGDGAHFYLAYSSNSVSSRVCLQERLQCVRECLLFRLIAQHMEEGRASTSVC